ncbi:MAG: hypothetical protein ACM3S1_14460 [Hyphomicrobiales bacterium]
MGKGSAEIQRDIERQRRSLSARVNQLDSRVRDDVHSVRSEASSRAQSLAERVKEPAGKVRDRALKAKDRSGELNSKLPGSDSALAEHPNLLLLGSFVAGLAGGIATAGGEDEAQERPRAEAEHFERRNGAHPERQGLLGKGMNEAKSLLGTELSMVLRDVMDGLMGKEHGGEGKEGEESGRIPAFLKSAWDSFSSKMDENRQRRESPVPQATHLEVRDRDLPQDRPLSDFEQRAAEDMGQPR